MANQEIVGIIMGKGNIIRETAKAICLNVWDDTQRGVWFPKSQLSIEIPEDPTQWVTIEMPWWLAADRFTTNGIYAFARNGRAYLKN